MMEDKMLKSCPFCGAEGDINYKKFAPYCINEDCFLNELDHGFETEQEAIEAWNRRANDAEVHSSACINQGVKQDEKRKRF